MVVLPLVRVPVSVPVRVPLAVPLLALVLDHVDVDIDVGASCTDIVGAAMSSTCRRHVIFHHASCMMIHHDV